MRGAPLIEARVCQYEQSADGHLIVDGARTPDRRRRVRARLEMLAGQALGEREKESLLRTTAAIPTDPHSA